MGDRKPDRQLDSLGNDFAVPGKPANIYEKSQPAFSLTGGLPGLHLDLGLTRQLSLGTDRTRPSDASEGSQLTKTMDPRIGRSQFSDKSGVSDSKASIKDSLKRSVVTAVKPTEAQLAAILATSKPDTPFRLDFPVAQLASGLSFHLISLQEPLQPKVVKFNEQGNKTIKYGYSIITNYKCDNSACRPVDIPPKDALVRTPGSARKVRSPPKTGGLDLNIDTNEDDLDNFSDAEYSAKVTTDDMVDRPEKIRRLMEKQLQISQHEENFRKKLENIKKNLEGGPESAPNSDRLNLSVAELQQKSKKLMEEVNSTRNKGKPDQSANDDQKRQQEILIDSKRQDEFILKFQNYVNEEKMKRSHNSAAAAPSPGPALQTSTPIGPRTSGGPKADQGMTSGRSLSNLQSRLSEYESLQLKSEVSDLEPNFENVRSLNFFFNPAIGSTNFIKNDYLEYVGIARNNNLGLESGFVGSSRGKDFLKKIPQNSLVFSQTNQSFEPNAIPVDDLTAPKTFQSGEKGESVFSESEEGASEQKFPFNEEPPSESFDYFKQGDPNDRVEEDDQNRLDNFESFKNQKPVFSDYHHYNQAYLQKFYHNYAEDMDEIYRKEMYGAPEALDIKLANPHGVPSSSNNPDTASKGSSHDPHGVRDGVYKKPGASFNPYEAQLQQFKDDILTDDPYRLQPTRTESDKSGLPHLEDTPAHRYFSFTQEQIPTSGHQN